LRLDRSIPSASGGNLSIQERVYCRLDFADGIAGYGEAAPHPIYGPPTPDIESSLRSSWQPYLSAAMPSALEMAILDGWARAAKRPVHDLLAWPAPSSEGYRTVTTFGGSDIDTLCHEIATSEPAGVKLKLTGTERDVEIVREVRR